MFAENVEKIVLIFWCDTSKESNHCDVGFLISRDTDEISKVGYRFARPNEFQNQSNRFQYQAFKMVRFEAAGCQVGVFYAKFQKFGLSKSCSGNLCLIWANRSST